MKKLLAILMCLVCLCSFTCAAYADEAEDVEIWVIDSTSVMQYHQIFKAGCEAAAEDLGVKLVYQAPTTSDDVLEQTNIIETAIATNPDAICINPIDLEAAVVPVGFADEMGIPVFCVDRGINSDIPKATVATNDIEATAVLAEEVGALMGGKGSILVIGHDNISKNGKERTYGFIDALNEKYPDIEVLDIQFGIDAALVTDQAKAMLTAYPEADVIYGTCEPTVMGILNAVKELELEHEVLVTGYDSGTQIMTAVRDGVMLGAITQSPYEQGYVLVELAYNYIMGETDIPKTVDAPFYFYNAENIDSPEVAACLYE